MDMDLFFKELMKKEEVKHIPVEIICRVVICVFEVINSGECFFREED